MSEAEVITFGCRLNAYESEVIRDNARAVGLRNAVIINTCAVTAEAERQARQMIRRMRRERPEARIIVTGCAAQIKPDAYASMPEVDTVLGNAEKLEAESYRSNARVIAGDIMAVRETAGHLIAGFDGRARALVQVQNGCDHRCTFCIIPFGRGPSRSVPVNTVVEQARRLVANGYREVVLSGVDLGAYGADLPGRPALGELVGRVLSLAPGLDRVRLSSIDPVEIDPELERLIAREPRVMPHLHLSVQSGDDMILKRMRRRHGRSDVIELCTRLRAARPEIAFGADLIAGFPTESEEMFENTLALVEEAGLVYLHVFPYSEREGTPAARMPRVPKPVRRARAARLRAAGRAALRRFLSSRIGTLASVLVERDGEGRSEHFAPVAFEKASAAPGSVVEARIVGVDEDRLIGRIA